jgi:hypothetical protein
MNNSPKSFWSGIVAICAVTFTIGFLFLPLVLR